MRILDLFCGSGGAARGYQQAGFECVGVDITPQPRYIGEHFIQADAMVLLAGDVWRDQHEHIWHIDDFQAIHASPPCQGYSIMRNLPWLRNREYPLLILPTMELLERTGKPYVLENVMNARYGARELQKRGLEAHGLKAGYLCGTMFGKPFYRHRLFATNWLWLAPEHHKHTVQSTLIRGTGKIDRFNQPKWGMLAGKASKAECAAVGNLLGIDWMKRKELSQAIPPCYTEHIGAQLRCLLTQQEARDA